MSSYRATPRTRYRSRLPSSAIVTSSSACGCDDGTVLKLARDECRLAFEAGDGRTERLAATPDRNGMLREVPMPTALRPLMCARIWHLQRVARAVDYSDTIEFWKSAPYLLNFMEDYKLKRAFDAASAEGSNIDATR